MDPERVVVVVARRDTQFTRFTAAAGNGIAFIETQNARKLRCAESYPALVDGAIPLKRKKLAAKDREGVRLRNSAGIWGRQVAGLVEGAIPENR